MNLREWALVAFTLLMQTSVGIVLVVTVSHGFVARGSAQASARAFDAPLLIATVTAALALVASLAHLGQPLHAWLAASNAGTSWLSREVLLALLFTVTAAALTALFRVAAASAGVRVAACLIAAAVGIAAIYAMSRIYMVPAQPAWNRIATPAGFFTTAAVLGALVVLVTFHPAAPGSPHDSFGLAFVRALVTVAIALVLVQVLLVPAQMAALVREPAAAISTASGGGLATWLAGARIVLALAAGFLLVGLLRATPAGAASTPAIVALVFMGVSEVLARVFFYASSVRL